MPASKKYPQPVPTMPARQDHPQAEQTAVHVDQVDLDHLNLLASLLGSERKALACALRVLSFQLKDSEDPRGDVLRLERHKVTTYLRKKNLTMKRGLDLQPMKR